LPVFFLSDGNDARVLVKHHEARAGCALLENEARGKEKKPLLAVPFEVLPCI